MSNEEFTIYIQTVDGKRPPAVIKHVTKDMKLETLKERIAETEGMAISEQRLVMDGKPIVDNYKSLESLGVKQSLTLYLVSQPGVLSNLFVRNLAGKTITFHDVSKTMSISEFKKMLVVTSGFDIGSVQDLRLIYSGKQLADDKCVKDYITNNDATIHAVARLRGGNNLL